ncbi:MAG: NAD(P)/FAD-dependent oxidoreductase [Clostridiales bacterium]|jgi:sarcosine oxidase subunit alpha|nr:NAD(P)/FAD-dependent oxidoreductase [Clostridiales bacterium]
MKAVDVVIIGGGPAGLAAAIGAKNAGAGSILVIERDSRLGGILNQCIHNGFGLHTFNEELTGSEYSARYEAMARDLGVPVLLNSMVVDITPDRRVFAVNERGVQELQAKAVVLAMGCRERPRGSLNIAGSRTAGIFTAGTAQKFVNIDGWMPGREVVVLGSGDIGLIMARRMTLEGASVKAVAEVMPYSGGLKRNIVQCLDDFGIPLLLSHTVIEIFGKDRLSGVAIAEVDESRKPIEKTRRLVPCDTLLLSVGLIPENELSKMAGVKLSPATGGPYVNESFQTSVEGIFACGNVLHVHDLVDFVSEESEIAGANAAGYAMGRGLSGGGIPVIAGNGVRYCVPWHINPDNVIDKISLRFRVTGVYRNSRVSVRFDDNQVFGRKSMILTPGEMESVTLKKETIAKLASAKKITVSVEEG